VQEKKQDVIELKDDSPIALEGLIRWVYGLSALEGETDTCANWIDMRVTADKYLATALSEQSLERFWEHARQIQTAEGILEVNEKIAADASHDTKLVSTSERLRGVWLHQIVQVPRFREELSDGPERMLAMIDQLSKGGNLSSMNRKLSPVLRSRTIPFGVIRLTTKADTIGEDDVDREVKWLYLCDHHGSVILSDPPRNPERNFHSCTFCDFADHSDEYLSQILAPEFEGIAVLLPFEDLDQGVFFGGFFLLVALEIGYTQLKWSFHSERPIQSLSFVLIRSP
jgi:hypothetical protein